VTLQTDLPYGPWPAQRLDIYRPARAEPCPVLVMVHGGAWMMGDKANARVVAHKVGHWLPLGWAVVSINYRMLPRADPLVQARDVAQALAWVQSHVADHGGDPQRTVLMGHSTGAHLGLLALADASLGAPQGAQALRGAVLLDSAALDVVQVMERDHLPLYDRAFGVSTEYWHRVSPWHQLQTALPPLLIVASADRDHSVAQARRFAERAVALGGKAQVLPVPLGHADINQQVGQQGELTSAIDDFLAHVAPG
jgi:acetyl esterase/lipase